MYALDGVHAVHNVRWVELENMRAVARDSLLAVSFVVHCGIAVGAYVASLRGEAGTRGGASRGANEVALGSVADDKRALTRPSFRSLTSELAYDYRDGGAGLSLPRSPARGLGESAAARSGHSDRPKALHTVATISSITAFGTGVALKCLGALPWPWPASLGRALEWIILSAILLGVRSRALTPGGSFARPRRADGTGAGDDAFLLVLSQRLALPVTVAWVSCFSLFLSFFLSFFLSLFLSFSQSINQYRDTTASSASASRQSSILG